MAIAHLQTSGWRVRVLAPEALTPADIAGWNALRAAHPEYDSPLLSPNFARIAATGRPDAKIALIEDAGGLAAVLAVYARPDGLGRPIGAPFSDYSGPIVRADAAISLTEIAALAGLGGYRTRSLVDPWNKFEAERSDPTRSQLVRMKGLTAAEYLEQRRAEYPKRFKNFRRLESLLGRDGHQMRFDSGALTRSLRDKLYAHKSAQYRATGLVDLIDAPRARRLLDIVEASPYGFQASLWSGDELISADFGFREGAAFHPWIAAYNPAFSTYSPGNLLQKAVITSMHDLGLASYDLAEGHDHYKKYFTNCGRVIYSADVAVPGWRGWPLKAQSAAWSLAGAGRDGAAAGRLKRRMDQAALCYDRTTDRLADLVTALRKRGVSAVPESGHAAPGDPAE